jgi:hypothetical protein
MKTFGPGEPITCALAFNFVLDTPGLLVYVKNWKKAVHPIIVANQQYRVVKRLMEQGQLSLAKKIK